MNWSTVGFYPPQNEALQFQSSFAFMDHIGFSNTPILEYFYSTYTDSLFGLYSARKVSHSRDELQMVWEINPGKPNL